MKIMGSFSLAETQSGEETQFSDVDGSMDMCDVKEEAQYVIFAPTDDCNEYDPLAIDNTIPTENPSSMAIKVKLNAHETECTDANTLYFPPDNDIHTTKVGPRSSKAIRVLHETPLCQPSFYLLPDSNIHTIKTEPRDSIATRVPHETPLCQPLVTVRTKRARMDLPKTPVEPLASPISCDPDIILCSDEEELITADVTIPAKRARMKTPKTLVEPLVSPMSCDPDIILCSSDEEELMTADCLRAASPAKRSSIHTPKTPVVFSTSCDTDVIPSSSVEKDPTTLADSSRHLIEASPCSNVLNSPVSSSVGATTPDSPPVGNNYYWSCEYLPSCSIPFTGKPRLKLSPIIGTPYDYFKLIFDREFYHIFTDQINGCAFEMRKENIVHKKNKDMKKTLITNWKPMTSRELDLWIAILIHKGGMQLPSLSDYWSRGLLHQSSFFSRSHSKMSKDEWMCIMQALHFLKTPGGELKSAEPFFKVNRLITWFNRRMEEVYEPERELYLEEPMVFWQGCLIPWSSLRDKRRGIKLHSLTDSGGLILRFTSDETDTSDESTASEVVKKLLRDFTGKGHSVFMDGCYTSVDLCHELLLSYQLHSTGPLPLLRKNFPEKVLDYKLELGHVIYARSNHGVVVMNWRDTNNQVMFISSELSPHLVETSYKSHIELKPEAVAVYDNHISGLNKPFHELSEYGAVQKHTADHVKIIVQLIQMAVYNAFVLYKKYGPNNMDFAQFRDELVRNLCCLKKTYLRAEVPLKEVWHRMDNIIPYEKMTWNRKNGNATKLGCKECRRNGRKTMVTTCCVVCPDSPALCLGVCFVDWHVNLGYSNVIEEKDVENLDKSN